MARNDRSGESRNGRVAGNLCGRAYNRALKLLEQQDDASVAVLLELDARYAAEQYELAAHRAAEGLAMAQGAGAEEEVLNAWRRIGVALATLAKVQAETDNGWF